MKFGGRSLEPYPTAIMWEHVTTIDVDGRQLTIRTDRWSADTQFYLSTPTAAAALAPVLDQLKGTIASVTQRGRTVRVRDVGAREIILQFANSAEAVQAAGIIDALRGREVSSIMVRGNQLTALIERRVVLTFENETRAGEIANLMEPLRQLCHA
jgi:hypothetical protein